MGPGLLESIYQSAMRIEFDEARVEYSRHTSIPAYYKGHLLGNTEWTKSKALSGFSDCSASHDAALRYA